MKRFWRWWLLAACVLCFMLSGGQKTAVIAQPASLFSAIQSVGGTPVIIKLIQGTQGKGVILARNLATAAAVMNKIQSAKRQALIQEFISESAGKDWRLIVVGNKCVAAMERQAAKEGEFRSNLHLGGTAVPINPDTETIKLAVAAAKAGSPKIVIVAAASPWASGIENDGVVGKLRIAVLDR